MVELLRSGELAGAFQHHFPLTPEEAASLTDCPDIFEWIERAQRYDDRDRILRAVVFPALLSDFLHFIYEALQAARKGKLSVAFALMRKPLQENLHLFELIAIDLGGFSKKLWVDPLQLQLKNVGGLDGHRKRIETILEMLGETMRFDAGYLAQLRYEKCEDGFDGVCNQAMHLFTSHDAIRTETGNLNFIFSDLPEKETQWAFLYSRLPYLLFYARLLVEHVFSSICDRTDPVFLQDIERRLEAQTILWWPSVDPHYRNQKLRKFVTMTRVRLRSASRAAGFGTPRLRDLQRMMDTGAWPNESAAAVGRRNARYARNAFLRD